MEIVAGFAHMWQLGGDIDIQLSKRVVVAYLSMTVFYIIVLGLMICEPDMRLNDLQDRGCSMD